jgi:hypothetical protein
VSNLGTYSFLPWLRQGIAGRITKDHGDTSVKARATIAVELELDGDPVGAAAAPPAPITRDVELYAPGDIVGIDRRAIVRTEPREWITNYEPNYLPHIEFYDEDFPWRYTPSRPDASGLQLRPWIALVVLAEDEFIDGKNMAGKPLPYIDVLDPAALPPFTDLWAWAHVHVNQSVAGSDAEFVTKDMAAVMPRLSSALHTNADLAYSRLISPRRLKANTAYHAFVVPSFESGRLAGLGVNPPTVPYATVGAWEPYTGRPPGLSLPVYHRWFFRTGTRGDFEYLVRLLQARPVDPRVGVRDVDVRKPGSGVPGITKPELGGVLRLGGALRVPYITYDQAQRDEYQRYEDWAKPEPSEFQVALAAFANLPDDYEAKVAVTANAGAVASSDFTLPEPGDPDPLITAPIYGTWHALTRRLRVERDGTAAPYADNWVHDLNLDPRFRLAAGFGTRVVQERQEEYMEAAWEQIGDVLEANRRIRLGQLAKAVSLRWHEKVLAPVADASPERLLTLTAPAQSHIRTGAMTMSHLRAQSTLPPVATSVALRRAVRPRGRFMKALPFDADVRPDNLLERWEAGTVTPAPPKTTPPGLVTPDEIADAIVPTGVPPAAVQAIRRFPWLRRALLIAVIVLAVAFLLLLLLGVIAGAVVALALALALLWLLRMLLRWQEALAAVDVITEGKQTVDAVDALPKSPDFVIADPGSTFKPHTGSTDSVQAGRFKDALRDWGDLFEASKASGTRPAPAHVDIAGLAAGAFAALDPAVTIPKRILYGIDIPGRIAGALDLSDFGEVMAYPEIDVPMYEPLKDISSELFLPNINLIGQNSITLLETNQRFIESYLIGLNHEFSRELLWREYPTDQRGSYFRQFWDARGAMTPAGMTPEQRKEALRDVPPINRWRRASSLGEHDHRERPGDNEEEIVLVIRGELLKKYPNAVIYAQLARWQRTDGHVDPSQERELVMLTEAEEAEPPYEKLRTPLYEAKVDPDITFFGFDLTAKEARGGSGDDDNDPAGWFFVIKERPGEPRMGFDIDGEPTAETVNDLTWDHVHTDEHHHVPATALSPLALDGLDLPEDDEKQEQRRDDDKVVGAEVSAARWAYLLYQAPVMMAVHATEMLRDPDDPDG